MNANAPVPLEFQDVHKAFGGKVVHDGVSLRLCQGELVGLFGGSGSGKSVLLRMPIGLERPDSGRVLFGGVDLTRLEERDFYAIRCQIGYVFQNGALFDSSTVEDNLAFPLRLHTSLSEEQILAKVNERLRAFGLEGTNDLYPGEISGGMQKRVGLLRALMLDQPIALFDEPTAGLDAMNIRQFAHLVLRYRAMARPTGLFVTHDIGLAVAVCDRIAVLYEGRIRAVDTVQAIRESADPVVRAFIERDYARPDPLEAGGGGGAP